MMAAATSTMNIISISSQAKRRIHPPRLTTSTSRINCIPRLPLLISRTQKCNFTIKSCLPPPPPPPPPRKTRFSPSTQLYVSGLSFRTTEESLRNAFKPFGELLEVKLVMDNIANRPKGFGFVRYATKDESRKAIEGMHGKVPMLNRDQKLWMIWSLLVVDMSGCNGTFGRSFWMAGLYLLNMQNLDQRFTRGSSKSQN